MNGYRISSKAILQATKQSRATRAIWQCSLSSRRMTHSVSEHISLLSQYSACDVSDALLKLQKPVPGKPARAGYIADLVPYAPSSPLNPNPTIQPKIIAPASTLQLIDKSSFTASTLPDNEANTIPKGSHWSDLTDPNTILVISQPIHQTCAAIGGIMASRMKVRGVTGCVVFGRVRDLGELKRSELPVWARAHSTVGQGAEALAYARNVPVRIDDVEVCPGDIVFCDPAEGVVVIPRDLVGEVLELMPRLVEADERVKEDVEKGVAVSEAFRRHRG